MSGKFRKIKTPHKVHILSWALSLEKTGSVPCHFKNCKFMSITLEEMAQHYTYSQCENALPFKCNICGQCSDNEAKILYHKIYSHSYSATQEELSIVKTFFNLGIKKEVTPILKRSWQIFLENKGYLKCFQRMCLFVPESLEEMEEHYLHYCKESVWSDLSLACKVCQGHFFNSEKLKTHFIKVHKSLESLKAPVTKSRLTENELQKSWGDAIVLYKQAKCPVEQCKFISNSVSTLDKHYRYCTGQKNLYIECPTCNHWLQSEEKLIEHRKCIHKDTDSVFIKEEVVDLDPEPTEESADVTIVLRNEQNSDSIKKEQVDNLDDCEICEVSKDISVKKYDRVAINCKLERNIGESQNHSNSITNTNSPIVDVNSQTNNKKSIDWVPSTEMSCIQYPEDIVATNVDTLDILNVNMSNYGKILNEGMMEETKLSVKSFPSNKRKSKATQFLKTSSSSQQKSENLPGSSLQKSESASVSCVRRKSENIVKPTPLEMVAHEMMQDTSNQPTVPVQIKVENVDVDWTVNIPKKVISSCSSKENFPMDDEALVNALRKQSLKLLEIVTKKTSIRADVKKVLNFSTKKYFAFETSVKNNNSNTGSTKAVENTPKTTVPQKSNKKKIVFNKKATVKSNCIEIDNENVSNSFSNLENSKVFAESLQGSDIKIDNDHLEEETLSKSSNLPSNSTDDNDPLGCPMVNDSSIFLKSEENNVYNENDDTKSERDINEECTHFGTDSSFEVAPNTTSQNIEFELNTKNDMALSLDSNNSNNVSFHSNSHDFFNNGTTTAVIIKIENELYNQKEEPIDRNFESDIQLGSKSDLETSIDNNSVRSEEGICNQQPVGFCSETLISKQISLLDENNDSLIEKHIKIEDEAMINSNNDLTNDSNDDISVESCSIENSKCDSDLSIFKNPENEIDPTIKGINLASFSENSRNDKTFVKATNINNSSDVSIDDIISNKKCDAFVDCCSHGDNSSCPVFSNFKNKPLNVIDSSFIKNKDLASSTDKLLIHSNCDDKNCIISEANVSHYDSDDVQNVIVLDSLPRRTVQRSKSLPLPLEANTSEGLNNFEGFTDDLLLKSKYETFISICNKLRLLNSQMAMNNLSYVEQCKRKRSRSMASLEEMYKFDQKDFVIKTSLSSMSSQKKYIETKVSQPELNDPAINNAEDQIIKRERSECLFQDISTLPSDNASLSSEEISQNENWIFIESPLCKNKSEIVDNLLPEETNNKEFIQPHIVESGSSQKSDSSNKILCPTEIFKVNSMLGSNPRVYGGSKKLNPSLSFSKMDQSKQENSCKATISNIHELFSDVDYSNDLNNGFNDASSSSINESNSHCNDSIDYKSLSDDKICDLDLSFTSSSPALRKYSNRKYIAKKYRNVFKHNKSSERGVIAMDELVERTESPCLLEEESLIFFTELDGSGNCEKVLIDDPVISYSDIDCSNVYEKSILDYYSCAITSTPNKSIRTQYNRNKNLDHSYGSAEINIGKSIYSLRLNENLERLAGNGYKKTSETIFSNDLKTTLSKSCRSTLGEIENKVLRKEKQTKEILPLESHSRRERPPKGYYKKMSNFSEVSSAIATHNKELTSRLCHLLEKEQCLPPNKISRSKSCDTPFSNKRGEKRKRNESDSDIHSGDFNALIKETFPEQYSDESNSKTVSTENNFKKKRGRPRKSESSNNSSLMKELTFEVSSIAHSDQLISKVTQELVSKSIEAIPSNANKCAPLPDDALKLVLPFQPNVPQNLLVMVSLRESEKKLTSKDLEQSRSHEKFSDSQVSYSQLSPQVITSPNPTGNLPILPLSTEVSSIPSSDQPFDNDNLVSNYNPSCSQHISKEFSDNLSGNGSAGPRKRGRPRKSSAVEPSQELANTVVCSNNNLSEAPLPLPDCATQNNFIVASQEHVVNNSSNVSSTFNIPDKDSADVCVSPQKTESSRRNSIDKMTLTSEPDTQINDSSIVSSDEKFINNLSTRISTSDLVSETTVCSPEAINLSLQREVLLDDYSTPFEKEPCKLKLESLPPSSTQLSLSDQFSSSKSLQNSCAHILFTEDNTIPSNQESLKESIKTASDKSSMDENIAPRNRGRTRKDSLPKIENSIPSPLNKSSDNNDCLSETHSKIVSPSSTEETVSIPSSTISLNHSDNQVSNNSYKYVRTYPRKRGRPAKKSVDLNEPTSELATRYNDKIPPSSKNLQNPDSSFEKTGIDSLSTNCLTPNCISEPLKSAHKENISLLTTMPYFNEISNANKSLIIAADQLHAITSELKVPPQKSSFLMNIDLINKDSLSDTMSPKREDTTQKTLNGEHVMNSKTHTVDSECLSNKVLLFNNGLNSLQNVTLESVKVKIEGEDSKELKETTIKNNESSNSVQQLPPDDTLGKSIPSQSSNKRIFPVSDKVENTNRSDNFDSEGDLEFYSSDASVEEDILRTFPPDSEDNPNKVVDKTKTVDKQNNCEPQSEVKLMPNNISLSNTPVTRRRGRPKKCSPGSEVLLSTLKHNKSHCTDSTLDIAETLMTLSDLPRVDDRSLAFFQEDSKIKKNRNQTKCTAADSSHESELSLSEHSNSDSSLIENNHPNSNKLFGALDSELPLKIESIENTSLSQAMLSQKKRGRPRKSEIKDEERENDTLNSVGDHRPLLKSVTLRVDEIELPKKSGSYKKNEDIFEKPKFDNPPEKQTSLVGHIISEEVKGERPIKFNISENVKGFKKAIHPLKNAEGISVLPKKRGRPRKHNEVPENSLGEPAPNIPNTGINAASIDYFHELQTNINLANTSVYDSEKNLDTSVSVDTSVKEETLDLSLSERNTSTPKKRGRPKKHIEESERSLHGPGPNGSSKDKSEISIENVHGLQKNINLSNTSVHDSEKILGTSISVGTCVIEEPLDVSITERNAGTQKKRGRPKKHVEVCEKSFSKPDHSSPRTGTDTTSIDNCHQLPTSINLPSTNVCYTEKIQSTSTLVDICAKEKPLDVSITERNAGTQKKRGRPKKHVEVCEKSFSKPDHNNPSTGTSIDNCHQLPTSVDLPSTNVCDSDKILGASVSVDTLLHDSVADHSFSGEGLKNDSLTKGSDPEPKKRGRPPKKVNIPGKSITQTDYNNSSKEINRSIFNDFTVLSKDDTLLTRSQGKRKHISEEITSPNEQTTDNRTDNNLIQTSEQLPGIIPNFSDKLENIKGADKSLGEDIFRDSSLIQDHISLPKKRGRPKRSLDLMEKSKDLTKSDISSKEPEVESTSYVENTISVPKKRGRPKKMSYVTQSAKSNENSANHMLTRRSLIQTETASSEGILGNCVKTNTYSDNSSFNDSSTMLGTFNSVHVESASNISENNNSLDVKKKRGRKKKNPISASNSNFLANTSSVGPKERLSSDSNVNSSEISPLPNQSNHLLSPGLSNNNFPIVPKRKVGRPRKSEQIVRESYDALDSSIKSFDSNDLASSSPYMTSENSRMRRKRQLTDYSDPEFDIDNCDTEESISVKRKRRVKAIKKEEDYECLDDSELADDSLTMPHSWKRKDLGERIYAGSVLKNPYAPVTCAVCKKKMTCLEYKKVHLAEHNFIAWLEGEEPLPVDDMSAMVVVLNRGKKHFPKHIFRCPVCNKGKRSAVGYFSHIQFCGKTETEKEKLLVSCEYCGRVMMPSSLPSHFYQSHHQPKELSKNEIADASAPDSARKAAIKCLGKIADYVQEEGRIKNKYREEGIDFNEDDDEETDEYRELSLLYIPIRKRITKNMKLRWKLKENQGEPLKCTLPSCDFTSKTYLEMLHHSKSCDLMGFSCIKCNHTCGTEDGIRDHVRECNPPIPLSRSDSSDSEDPDKTNLLSFLKTDELKMSFEKSRGHFFKPALSYMKDLSKIYFSKEPLYPELRTTINHWQGISAEESQKYITMNMKSLKLDFASSQMKEMDLFESMVSEDGSAIGFTGGPIWGMAWCPGEGEQFIATSPHMSMEYNFQNGSTHTGPGIVQIWSLGDINNSGKSSVEYMKFSFGICHEEKGAWDLAWCPSGGRSSDSLGLLALACLSGSIPIYDVPQPKTLPLNTNRFFKPEPVLKLELNANEKWQCSALSWSKLKPHRIITAGFVNGVIAVWDLSIQSKLLRPNSKILHPFKIFQAHNSFITGVCLSPESEEYLASSSFDKSFKFWDLRDTTSPLSVTKRGLFTGTEWLRHWMMAVNSYDIAYTLAQTTISLSPIRDFMQPTVQVSTTTNSTSWSVSTNDWLNCIASSYDNGQAMVIFALKHILCNYKDKKKFSKVIVQSTLEELPKAESGTSSISDNSAHTMENLSLTVYENASKKFGLKIKMDPRVREFGAPGGLSENTDEGKIDVYPLNSINKISWNPNEESFCYLAMGYQSGFLMVLKLAFPPVDQSIIDLFCNKGESHNTEST